MYANNTTLRERERIKETDGGCANDFRSFDDDDGGGDGRACEDDASGDDDDDSPIRAGHDGDGFNI